MSDENNNSTDPLLLNHEYDGIRELDYPLPGWWLATFFITIIFGVIYWIHYDLSGAGPTLSQELKMDMAKIEALRETAAADAPEVTEEALASLVQDPDALEKGRAEYLAKCAACHGNVGEGLIGPNMTDTYWKNTDGSLVGIHKVIVTGVIEKGMPAWKGLIDDDLLKQITAYIASLKGSNPPNGKAAEGTMYE